MSGNLYTIEAVAIILPSVEFLDTHSRIAGIGKIPDPVQTLPKRHLLLPAGVWHLFIEKMVGMRFYTVYRIDLRVFQP